MNSNTLKLYLTLLIVLLLTGCGATIETPRNEKVYTDPPDVIIKRVEPGPNFRVLLNDQDITDFFVFDKKRATAEASNIATFLVDGQNSLQMIDPDTDVRNFYFDNTGPLIHLLNVSRNGDITLSGYAEDPSGVASVRVNNKAVTLDFANRFALSIPNASIIRFTTTDQKGFQREQVFAAPGNVLSQALGIRVGQGGLNFVATEIENLVEADVFAEMVRPLNPIDRGTKRISVDAGPFSVGANVKYEIKVNDVTINSADFNLKPTNNNEDLEVSGALRGAYADLTIYAEGSVKVDLPWPADDIKISLDATMTGDLDLNEVSFKGELDAVANNGTIDSHVSLSQFNMSGIDLDIDGAPGVLGDFVSWLGNRATFLLELILKPQVSRVASNKVGEFINVYLPSIALGFNNSVVNASIKPTDVLGPSEGLDIQLAANISPQTTHGPLQAGSLHRANGFLPAPSTISPNGTQRHVGIVVSEDIINQALAAATRSGMLNITLPSDAVPVLANIDPANSVIRARMVPSAAPSVDLLGAQEKGLGVLTFNDFYLAFEAYSLDKQVWELMLGAELNVGATFDIGMTEQNNIALEVIGNPRIELLEFRGLASFLVNENTAQNLIDDFVPLLLPIALQSVGIIPMPSFSGYSAQVGEIWVAEDAGKFAALTADLTKVTSGILSTTATNSSISGASILNYEMPIPVATSTASVNDGNQGISPFAVNGALVIIPLDNFNENRITQYRYRLDSLPFSLWRQRDAIELYGLKDGTHLLEICARMAASEYCQTEVLEIDNRL